MKKSILLLLLSLFLSVVIQAQNKTYKEGDKVEVKFDGEWAEGIYVADLTRYKSMKATPHRIKFSTMCGKKGTNHFADADVRPFTGKIDLPFTLQAKANTVNLGKLEKQVIEEVNEMRTNPKAYAKKLENLKKGYVESCGKWWLDIPGEGAIRIGSEERKVDHEKWLEETIAALNQSPNLSELVKNDELRTSCDYLASDKGSIDRLGHKDSEGQGVKERATKAGYEYLVNECLNETNVSAYGFVSTFLIDWRVASRGHRKNLMNPDLEDIGVACQYFSDDKNGYIRTVIQGGFEMKEINKSEKEIKQEDTDKN